MQHSKQTQYTTRSENALPRDELTSLHSSPVLSAEMMQPNNIKNSADNFGADPIQGQSHIGLPYRVR